MKGQKKKAMWAKKRVENAEKRAAELKANTQRTYRKSRVFKEIQPRESKHVITEGMAHVASLPSRSAPAKPIARLSKPKPMFSMAEYLEREAAAKKEIERKKKMVAPLYNKGGYQYVGDDADPEIIKNLGKKI